MYLCRALVLFPSFPPLLFYIPPLPRLTSSCFRLPSLLPHASASGGAAPPSFLFILPCVYFFATKARRTRRTSLFRFFFLLPFAHTHSSGALLTLVEAICGFTRHFCFLNYTCPLPLCVGTPVRLYSPSYHFCRHAHRQKKARRMNCRVLCVPHNVVAAAERRWRNVP